MPPHKEHEKFLFVLLRNSMHCIIVVFIYGFVVSMMKTRKYGSCLSIENLDYHIQVLTGSALYLLVETSAVSTAVQPSFFCGHGSTMAVPQKQTDMLIADHLFGQLLID